MSEPRAFSNPYKTYSPETAKNIISDKKLTQECVEGLKNAALNLLKIIEKEEDARVHEQNFSVYTGAAGIALMYIKLYQR